MVGSMPLRTAKYPSGVRSPVVNSRSRSSMSLVSRVAPRESLRATRIDGTSQTSDASRAAFDHRFHEIERVNRAAEAGFGLGDDRRHPVAAGVAFAPFDLVGAQERVVEPPNERRDAVRRVDALVG